MQANPRQKDVSTLAVLWLALSIGAVAFGGGFAIIARIKQKVVDEYGWMSTEAFAAVLAVTAALPGTNAANLMAVVGARQKGPLVGALAVFCFLLPGSILMLLLAASYGRLRGVPAVGAALAGIAAAVVGIVAAVAEELRPAAVKRRLDLVVLVVTFGCLATQVVGLLELVVLAGLYGVFVHGPVLTRERQVSRERVDDPSFFLLAAPAAVPLSTGLFFSFAKISLATFGGGVAMIPAIEREVVGRGWVDGASFSDAIAFSQLTPGPIAACSTFLGYRAAGLPGALAATAGVFLPPLILSLLVARSLPSLEARPRLRAFFSGVSVAVVGAILAAAYSVYRVGVHGVAATAFAVVVFGWRRWRPSDGTLWPLLAGATFGLLQGHLRLP